jgi:hypothetical protein
MGKHNSMPIIDGKRVCTSCRANKPVEEFYKTKNRRGEVVPTPTCQACCTERDFLPQMRYSRLRSQSKLEGKALAMTLEEYSKMVGQPCYYCGRKVRERGRGLDRLATDGPYSVDNCVSSCGICNVTRSDIFNIDEMKRIIGPAIRQVYEERDAKGEPLAYPSFLDRKARTTRREDLRSGRYGGTHWKGERPGKGA